MTVGWQLNGRSSLNKLPHHRSCKRKFIKSELHKSWV